MEGIQIREIRAFLYLIVFLILLQLTGCVPREGERQRLTYSVWGSVRQTEVEQLIVEKFEAENPQIEIQLMTISKGYQEKLQAMMVGGTAPDVMMLDSMVYGDWANRGALLDITELVEELHQQDEFMPVALDTFQTGNDQFFALPVNTGTMVMYVNLDALAHAGITLPDQALTWEAFEALGPLLSNSKGSQNSPTDYLCVPPLPTSLLLSFGVFIFDNPRNPTRVDLEMDRLIEAIMFYRRLVSEGWASPSNAIVDSGANQLFRDGRVAFLFSGRHASTEFSGYADFSWDIALAPRNAGGMMESGGTGLAISKNSKVPELAKRFLEFYASEQAVRIATEGGRIVPTRRRFAFGDHFLGQTPPQSIRLFSETQEAGSSEALLYGGGLRELHDILYRRMEQTIAEPNRPVSEIAEGMKADFERWLRKRDLK